MSNVLYDTNIVKAHYLANYIKKYGLTFEEFRYNAYYRISDEDLENDEKDNLNFETRIIDRNVLDKLKDGKCLNRPFESLAYALTVYNLCNDVLLKFNDKQMIYVKAGFKKRHITYGIVHVDRLLKYIIQTKQKDYPAENNRQEKILTLIFGSIAVMGLFMLYKN